MWFLHSEKQEKLMAQLEDIHEQLNEAKVDIRSDQREARFREVLDSMKRIFPGLIGSMVTHPDFHSTSGMLGFSHPGCCHAAPVVG